MAESFNPYQPPTAGPPEAPPPDSGFAVSSPRANNKNLNFCRGALFLAGVMTIVISLMVHAEVDNSVRSVLQHGQEIEQDRDYAGDPRAYMELREAQRRADKRADEILRPVLLATVGKVGIGVVYVVLALLVRRAPVTAAVAGLILYALPWALDYFAGGPYVANTYLNLKVATAAALIYALFKAVAYHREQGRVAQEV